MAPSAPSWREVSVPVGWGFLRGKTCHLGEPRGGAYLRVLALHGWLDNANSFDALLPLLPEGLEVLSLDLAGHGLSDHLPVGGRYDVMTHVVYLREAVQRLGWSGFVLLAHSLGALIANYYTALYPRDVRALVVLDYLRPFHKEDRLATWRAENGLMQREEQGRGRGRRAYSEDEALARMVEARKGGYNKELPNLDKDAARILLPRAARRVDGGYVWRHDEKARTRYSMLYGDDNWMYVISHITCPVMAVRADDGLCQQPDDAYAPVLEAYRKSARVFRFDRIPGGHHVHLTHPDRVAPSVSHFLTHDVLATQDEGASKL
ncbi:serine hydrolase-like protein [Penaeus japonicus]|uniref:serine hydrolase-like protein n=1 Tax=Penaeus japonicus TaxID=27405 RepID=UPI001C710EFE|nr:serine hydrolase-like protein [Penaeus japonicus]